MPTAGADAGPFRRVISLHFSLGTTGLRPSCTPVCMSVYDTMDSVRINTAGLLNASVKDDDDAKTTAFAKASVRTTLNNICRTRKRHATCQTDSHALADLHHIQFVAESNFSVLRAAPGVGDTQRVVGHRKNSCAIHDDHTPQLNKSSRWKRTTPHSSIVTTSLKLASD